MLIEEELTAPSEELFAIGPLSRNVAGHRDALSIYQRLALSSHHEEVVLAKQRVVALEHVLPIWVVNRALGVARVVRIPDAPAVRPGHRIGGLLFGVFDPRRSGVTRRRIDRCRERRDSYDRGLRLEDPPRPLRRGLRNHVGACCEGAFAVVAIAALERNL